MTFHLLCELTLMRLLTSIFILVSIRPYCNSLLPTDQRALILRSQLHKRIFQEKSYTGQETYKRDVKHNIKRDEHVDTAVQNFEYGDTEVYLKGSETANHFNFQVTTVKKTITQREVHETIETLSGEKKFSTQESTTPKVRTIALTIYP